MMKSNDDKIPAADLHGKATESLVSSLVKEVVTSSTDVDSGVLDNGAAIELSLAGRKQLPPFCVEDLSSPSVMFDVDLVSFGMILLLDSPLCLLLHMMF